jgi:hypothetical protein
MPEIKKITDFTELAEIPADNDVLPIVDLSEAQLINRNKKITYNKLVKQALAELQTLIENKIKDTVVYLKAVPETTLLTVQDGVVLWTVPEQLNGMQIAKVAAAVYNPSSSGNPTIQINKAGYDLLTTRITIDVNETTSYTAATQPVINASYKTLATKQVIRIDVDAKGTGTKGLDVIIVVNP